MLAALHERSGEVATFDSTEIAPLPSVTGQPIDVLDVLHDRLLSSQLAVPARACHLTLRLPDASAASTVARVLAVYGARMILAPGWGRRGRHHVGVAVGLADTSYSGRIRRDLARLDYGFLVVDPGTWIPAIVPDSDGLWRVLAHATRQDSVHIAEELFTDVDAAALVGLPLVAAHTGAARRSSFRPTDEMLALYPQLFRSHGGHILTLGPDAKAGSAPYAHRLTPWDAVAAGHAYTAALRPDIAGFDLDTGTSIRAALSVQERFGLPPLVVWHSGSDGHLAGVTRVAPRSMADLADIVHNAEAALCAERGLPRPDRMVVRGGTGARMRPPASPSVKPGARVGTGVGVLHGVSADSEPIITWLPPSAVPEVLGLGGRPVVLPPAWLRAEAAGSTGTDPSDTDLRRAGVSRSRDGIVATTAADVIARWGLGGNAALALTLPRSHLLDRTSARVDTSRWVGALLAALVIRGADDESCVAAVEACEGLALGYKGGRIGSPRLAARIRWELQRVRGRVGSERRPSAPVVSNTNPFADTFAARAAEVWGAWASTAPSELLTAAAFLAMARDARRLAFVGVGARRMGAWTGSTPETAASRLRHLVDVARIELAQPAHFDPEHGWRANRYNVVMHDLGPPVPGRPPLDVMVTILTTRMPWVRGLTPGALLALASAMHHGVVTIEDLTAHWGMTTRQAETAARRVAEVKIIAASDDSGAAAGALASFDSAARELRWRQGASLEAVARLTGANERHKKALATARDEQGLLPAGRLDAYVNADTENAAAETDAELLAAVVRLPASTSAPRRSTAA